MRQHGSAPKPSLDPALAVVLTLAGVAAMLAGGTLVARSSLGLRAQIAIGTFALAAPALLVVLGHGRARRAVLGEARIVKRTALLSVLLGAGLWLASLGLMELQSLLMPPPPQYLEAFRALHKALVPTGPLDLLVSLVVIAVLPGLCEELVMRGVLLPSLASWLPSLTAVLVSAALFAAIHRDPYRFLFTFTIGVVLGLVRLSTGSLWPPVIAHASLNTLTFLIAPYVDDPSQAYTPQPVLGLVCLVAGCALTLPLLRQLTPRPASHASHGPGA